MKGFFAEEGLRVQGMMTDMRSAVEQGKPHMLWVKTEQGLTEADFGYLDLDQLHHIAGELTLIRGEVAPQGIGRSLIGAGSAAEPQIDAAGIK